MTRYEKVGRLLARPDDRVSIIRDGHGEIGSVKKDELMMGVMGLGPVRVCPEGTGQLSESGRSIRFIIPGYRGVFVALARQVRGMIERWPARKAAVFWEEG